MPQGAANIIEVKEGQGDRIKNHRVVGCGPVPGASSQNSSDQKAERRFGQINGPLLARQARDIFLANETYDVLKQLYAQDMFSAFMWAAVKTMEAPLEGDADLLLDDKSGVDTR
jgi:hypothetical protein